MSRFFMHRVFLIVTSCSRPRVAVAQSHAVPSRPVPSRPVPPRPIPSRPISSRRIPSRPVLYHPVPSHAISSRPVPYIKKRAYWNARLRQTSEAIGEELS
jgi:hypothetical protein